MVTWWHDCGKIKISSQLSTASFLLMYNLGNARIFQTQGHVDEKKTTKIKHFFNQ